MPLGANFDARDALLDDSLQACEARLAQGCRNFHLVATTQDVQTAGD